MRVFFLKATATVTGALLVSSALQAAENDITAEEVEGYFAEITQEASELVRAGELERIVEWVDHNFADGANFQANMNVLHGEQHKGFLALTLDKDDMLAMGGMFAAPLGQAGFEDYSLEVEVLDVTSHGPGAATATIRWTERATLAPPRGDMPADVEVSSVAVAEEVECTQIVQRNGERLQMGLMTCVGEIRF
jgi:hypothetical protein